MMRLGRWLMVGAFALGGMAGTAAAHGKSEEHAGKKISLQELPSSVRSTFEQEASGGQIEELRSMKSGGKLIYEGEVVQNGKGTDLKVASDGSVLSRSAPHDEATEQEHQKGAEQK